MLENCRFHHIGYAVQDIMLTAEFYLSSGWELSDIYNDLIQNTRIAFLKREQFPLIELVAPIDDKSPVVNTLDKSGVSPYHICYEVDDITSAILELRKKKFIALFKPVPAIALDNKLICYLYNKSVGLIELVSKN
jgi:methylmalonyl-CoA/ethylmalonyl-CoA epimerase